MRSRFPAAAAALLLLGVSGCTLKAPPDAAAIRSESMPHASTPEHWVADAGAPGEVADGWLASFASRELDALVAEALAYNADLGVAAARVEQAGAYARVAGAKTLPTVELSAHGGSKLGGDSSGLSGVWLSASWEIDVWGRVRHGKAAAESQFASAEADFAHARQSIAALTARSWFLTTEARLQRETAAEVLRDAEELVVLARERERIGRGDAIDTANAEARVQTSRDTLKQADVAYSQSRRALEILLGRYPAAAVDVAGKLADMPGPVPAGLPSQLLERRPDVIAAERRVAAAFDRVEEAKAARLPRIALTATGSSISSELFVLKEQDNPVWSVGANLLAPLYQGGALRAQVDLRSAEQKQALADYARTGLRAFGEVENALASEFALVERETALARAAAENERALELAKVRYGVGSGDLRAVLQQQMALASARVSLLRVQGERRAQRISLHLALGGGFALPKRTAALNR